MDFVAHWLGWFARFVCVFLYVFVLSLWLCSWRKQNQKNSVDYSEGSVFNGCVMTLILVEYCKKSHFAKKKMLFLWILLFAQYEYNMEID